MVEGGIHTNLINTAKNSPTVLSDEKNTIQRTLNSSLKGDVTGSVGGRRLMIGAILKNDKKYTIKTLYVVEDKINDR